MAILVNCRHVLMRTLHNSLRASLRDSTRLLCWPTPFPFLSSDASEEEKRAMIVKILNGMGQNEKANRQMFKSRAYFRAAKAIRDSKVPVTSGKAAQQLEGVGKKIALKIDEILATGVLVGPLFIRLVCRHVPIPLASLRLSMPSSRYLCVSTCLKRESSPQNTFIVNHFHSDLSIYILLPNLHSQANSVNCLQ